MNPAKGKKIEIGIVEISQQVGISPERLRYWERLGIVKPRHLQYGTRKFRRYSGRDIKRAVLVKMLVDIERYTLAGALRKLEAEGGDKI
jgi:DNA-binding transcriptional MerR regulator